MSTPTYQYARCDMCGSITPDPIAAEMAPCPDCGAYPSQWTQLAYDYHKCPECGHYQQGIEFPDMEPCDECGWYPDDEYSVGEWKPIGTPKEKKVYDYYDTLVGEISTKEGLTFLLVVRNGIDFGDSGKGYIFLQGRDGIVRQIQRIEHKGIISKRTYLHLKCKDGSILRLEIHKVTHGNFDLVLQTIALGSAIHPLLRATFKEEPMWIAANETLMG